MFLNKRKSVVGPHIVTPAANAAASSSDPNKKFGTFRGFLFARVDDGGESQTFKEKWFVLHRDRLLTFDKPDDETGLPVDVISLRQAKVKQVGDDWIQRRIAYGYIPPELALSSAKSKAKGFEIVIHRRRSVEVVYELLCRSGTEAAQWVSRVSEQIVIARDAQYFVIAEEVITDSEIASFANMHIAKLQEGSHSVAAEDLEEAEKALDDILKHHSRPSIEGGTAEKTGGAAPSPSQLTQRADHPSAISIPGMSKKVTVTTLLPPSIDSAGSYDHTASYAAYDLGSSVASHATAESGAQSSHSGMSETGKIIARHSPLHGPRTMPVGRFGTPPTAGGGTPGTPGSPAHRPT